MTQGWRSKRTRLGWSLRALYLVYQLVAIVVFPLALIALLNRSRKEPAHRSNLKDRFGLGPVGPKGAIWVYAASLGEVHAANPLIKTLLAQGHHILLTNLSPAGRAAARTAWGQDDRVTISYVPYDFAPFLQLFLRRAGPMCGVVLEIETWPSQLFEADRLRIPMILANGNLLDRAVQKTTALSRVRLSLYRLFDHVLTRNEAYQNRYQSIGLDASAITLTGDLRFSVKIPPQQIAQGQSWRENWGAEFALVIASSVKDEEPILVKAVAQILQQTPHARIIWVPRSPQRFDAVAQILSKAGHRVETRSQTDGKIKADTQIFVGDSLGEMYCYLAMADCAFVGASFIDHGGHNVIEPLSVGLPVIMGPSDWGVRFATEPALHQGAFIQVKSAGELADQVQKWATDANALSEAKSKAAGVFSDQSTAADRAASKISEFLKT